MNSSDHGSTDMHNLEPVFANDGYRPNVGIIIHNKHGKVFWARRINRDGWQFPQGGVSKSDASVEAAMFRELKEETGLYKNQVKIVAHTKNWLHYDLPARMLPTRRRKLQHKNSFKGQKQVWFLLELLDDDAKVNLAYGSQKPEFDSWRWVDAEFAIDNIVDFKRAVYRKAISELGQFLPQH